MTRQSMLNSVWIVPLAAAVEEEEGSEMESLEKSSIAFFAGLSLISSPGRKRKKKSRRKGMIGATRKEERRESSQKAFGRVCEGLRLTRTTMSFSLAACPNVEASPAVAAMTGSGGGAG